MAETGMHNDVIVADRRVRHRVTRDAKGNPVRFRPFAVIAARSSCL